MATKTLDDVIENDCVQQVPSLAWRAQMLAGLGDAWSDDDGAVDCSWLEHED